MAKKSARSKPVTTKKGARKRGRPRRAKRHTPAERARILATAQREGLTGAQAAKRFGISTVTYYLWRQKAKKAGGGRPRRARAARGSLDGAASRALTEAMRKEVRAKIGDLLPGIIESEVANALGSRSRRGRR